MSEILLCQISGLDTARQQIYRDDGRGKVNHMTDKNRIDWLGTAQYFTAGVSHKDGRWACEIRVGGKRFFGRSLREAIDSFIDAQKCLHCGAAKCFCDELLLEPECEMCGEPATRKDRDGIPLCEGDWMDLIRYSDELGPEAVFLSEEVLP